MRKRTLIVVLMLVARDAEEPEISHFFGGTAHIGHGPNRILGDLCI